MKTKINAHTHNGVVGLGWGDRQNLLVEVVLTPALFDVWTCFFYLGLHEKYHVSCCCGFHI